MSEVDRSLTGMTVKRSAGRGVRLVLRWAVTVGVAGAVLALGLGLLIGPAKAFFTAGKAGSDMAQVELAPLATRSGLYAADGTLLQFLYGDENRVPVSLDKVPPEVVKAVLDAEDDRFFEHGPVDLRAMTRAMVSNLEAGQISEGGSTITQQLVKITLLSPKKSLDRKLQEAALAIRLERQMTKSQILERYLNTVYFGNGAYGLQAAAERYFQTNVDKLTLGQGILLAGLIRNPVGADPYANPEAARDRRNTIVDRMEQLGDVSSTQAVELKAEPLPTPVPAGDVNGTNYFTRRVVDQLLSDPRYLGGTEAERNRLVFRGGLKIVTTISPADQATAEKSIADTLPPERGEFNAALVSVEPSTGAVRAAVSGLDFAKLKINLVDGAGRQVGSAFKMLTLTAAIESGLIPADTILGSAPCVIPDPNSVEKVWDPSNVEGQAGGLLTLTEATVNSVNCAYARLIKVVGPEKVVDVARRMGIRKADLKPYLSLTLGTADVTPLEMASAYATLANDGEYREPYFIDRIEDRNGKVIFKQATKPERAIAVTDSRTVTQVLTQVVQRGTGTAAQVPGWQVAGKTGSTDLNQDAWFVGITPKLATAIWMGSPAGKVSMYNVGRFPKVYGGTYPAMIFSAYTTQVLAAEAVVGFPPPDPTPNQRAPRYLSIDQGVNQDLGPQQAQGPHSRGNYASPPPRSPAPSPSQGGDPPLPAPTPSVPTPSIPPAPVITVPIPDVPTPPRVTVPSYPPRATTPTTRRERGVR